MNRNSLTTAVIAGIAGVAGIANMASAVNLNPDGVGQVLLYPYYTVNGGQQTLLSVVNTDTVNGKAVKVRFLEGYNSREVLDFNLFLSPADVWTAGLFALADLHDAAVTGTGGAIFTTDNSCTAPPLNESTSGGIKYVAFRNFAYSGSNADTGPATNDRTREGHFEMIQMADIVGGPLLTDITHVNSVPPKCGNAEGDFEANTLTAAPTGGLFGAATVVNVAKGSYYAFNADALDGFSSTILNFGTQSLSPSLANVNDAGSPATVTSLVFNNGALITSPYPGTNAIDAVSSVFAAANIYNEYQASANGSVGTDWVVNFPTKRFYVDGQPGGEGVKTVIAPFEHLFGAKDPGNGLGLSCTVVGISIYDREENTTAGPVSGFSPPPPDQPPSSLCHETNVITFNGTGATSILSSGLTVNITPLTPDTSGWTNLTLTGNAHDFRLANNGNQFHGLPITGFEALKFTNGNVGGVLANYAGVYRHRQSRSCTNAGVGLPTANGSGNTPPCS